MGLWRSPVHPVSSCWNGGRQVRAGTGESSWHEETAWHGPGQLKEYMSGADVKGGIDKGIGSEQGKQQGETQTGGLNSAGDEAGKLGMVN